MALIGTMSGLGMACTFALSSGTIAVASDDVAASIATDPENAAPEAREPEEE